VRRGSKERINAGLTQILIDEVRALAGARGTTLSVHYLPLPVAFRSRGGFGTHWMFASNIRVANPHLPEQPEDSTWGGKDKHNYVNLDREEVVGTLRALFDPDEPICDRADRIRNDPVNAAADFAAGWTTDVQQVARWVCRFDDRRGTQAGKADFQVEAWKKVVRELGPPQRQ
jgi:hypothetical protein